MRRLVLDLLRRKRVMAICCVTFVAVMWGMAAQLNQGASRAIGASMATAFFFGAWLMWIVPRPIWYLPVSKREIWRASWFVATVVATLLTTSGKLVAMLVPAVRDSFGVSALLLSSACDFAYTGFGCALAIVASRPLPASVLWRPFAYVAKGVAEAAPVLAPSAALFLGGLYGGIEWLGPDPVVPGRWGELTARSSAVLVAAFGLAIASWFHVPTPPSPVERAAALPRDRTPAAQLDPVGLTGLPRLIVHEYAWTMVCAAFLVGGCVVVVVVLAGLSASPEGFAGIVRTALLVFDQTIPPPPGGGYQALIVLMLFACFGASLAARFPLMVRHLRVLPLGSRRLTSFLMGWSVLVWVTFWTAWLMLHVAVVGDGMTSLRPTLIAALAGITALVQGIALRFSGRSHALGVGASLLVVPIVLFVDPPPAASFFIASASAVAAAALIYEALQRTATYRNSGDFFEIRR